MMAEKMPVKNTSSERQGIMKEFMTRVLGIKNPILRQEVGRELVRTEHGSEIYEVEMDDQAIEYSVLELATGMELGHFSTIEEAMGIAKDLTKDVDKYAGDPLLYGLSNTIYDDSFLRNAESREVDKQ
jgi:hypothetical protein